MRVLVSLLACVACLQQCQGLSVEIQEFWGNLNMKLGSSEDVTCSASGIPTSSGVGSFTWLLDGESLGASSNVLSDSEEEESEWERTYMQTLTFVPKLEYDGKKLTCRYTSDDSTTAEDSLAITVSFHEFPVGSVNSGEYAEGLPAELEVAFRMHPEPNPDDFVWVVNEGEEDELRLKLSSSSGAYRSGDIESAGGDMSYIVSLEVASAGPEEVQRSHKLVVKLDEGISKSIPVEFQLLSREPAPTESPALPELPEEESTTMINGPSTAETMSVGLVVIVAFIVLILLICVGYCIYHKCCKKDPSQTNGAYQKTATQEQA